MHRREAAPTLFPRRSALRARTNATSPAQEEQRPTRRLRPPRKAQEPPSPVRCARSSSPSEAPRTPPRAQACAPLANPRAPFLPAIPAQVPQARRPTCRPAREPGPPARQARASPSHWSRPRHGQGRRTSPWSPVRARSRAWGQIREAVQEAAKMPAPAGSPRIRSSEPRAQPGITERPPRDPPRLGNSVRAQRTAHAFGPVAGQRTRRRGQSVVRERRRSGRAGLGHVRGKIPDAFQCRAKTLQIPDRRNLPTCVGRL